ncbi:hypothetical protein [Paenibacillus sp. B2(2019)]|nr:hypothetical protein [Paenibacillus sp. B2(2019)]
MGFTEEHRKWVEDHISRRTENGGGDWNVDMAMVSGCFWRRYGGL